MDELIRCRVTMRPDEWLEVDQAEHDSLRRMKILIEEPTPEIDQQEPKAAAAATRKTKPKGSPLCQ